MSLYKVGYVIPTIRDSSKEISDYFSILRSNFSQKIQVIIVNDNPKKEVKAQDFINPGNLIDVTIINNKNSVGPGASRNIGIEKLQSEWVGFLDDDDVLLPRRGKSFNNINDCSADIICLQFQDSKGTFSNYDVLNCFVENNPVISDSYLLELERSGRLPTHCQHYFFKRDFLYRNEIKFLSTGIVEDLTFVSEAVFYSNKIAFDKHPYYYYVSRSGTSKEDTGLHKALDIFSAINHLERILNSNNSNADFNKLNFLRKIKKFLESLFVSRSFFLDLNKVSSIEIHEELSTFISYSNNIKSKFYFSLETFFNSSKMVVFFCYCPMSIGLVNFLKMKFPEIHYAIIDDNANSIIDIHDLNLMLPEKFFSSKDFKRYLDSNPQYRFEVVICHLHRFAQDKIVRKIYDQLSKNLIPIGNVNLKFFNDFIQ